jgi:divalent metal cation (Fe/Co/Zn/Cd) transporter
MSTRELAVPSTGWWWADPVAALILAAVAVYEGIESWRGEECC